MRVLVASDAQKSLDAMWHAYRASPFVAQNCDLVPTSVVQALLNARYYDKSRGQFLSEDPLFLSIGSSATIKQLTGRNMSSYLADPQQQNAFSYGRDNPVATKDPLGLDDPGTDIQTWFAYRPDPGTAIAKQLLQSQLQAAYGGALAAVKLSGAAIASAATTMIEPATLPYVV